MSPRASHYIEPVPFDRRPEHPEPGDECYLDLTLDAPRPETRLVLCWCPPTPPEGFLMGCPA